MNEFTLAGAVLADSLGRGAGKKNGGEPTHSSPKSATFSKNTIHPHNLAMDCFTLSGFAMTLQNIPGGYCTPRVHYAHATHGRWRVIALFLVYESVEVSVRGQEQNSASLPLFCSYPVFLGNKKGVELNAFTYLRPSTALHK